MKRLLPILMILTLLTLAACRSSGNEEIPTPVPTINLAEVEVVLPTITPTPTLIATWTPLPYAYKEAGWSVNLLLQGNNGSNILLPVTGGASGYYIVARGDTLATIANAAGCSIYDLARINRIGNINRIEVGQALSLACR